MSGEPQIVAFGGGGLGDDGGPLRRFVLDLSRQERPRVLYVPTATGDSDEAVVSFYSAFAADACVPSHLPLFFRRDEDLRNVVMGQHVICVAGGNTANMLAVWRVHGLDVLLREAWRAGIVLCGGSAGSLCWYEAGVTDSFGPHLQPLRDGLGFLAGSHCPHYDGEPQRRPTYRALVAAGLPAGIAADDGVGLHYVERELVEVVTGREGSGAYRVERGADGGVVETPLAARLLPG